MAGPLRDNLARKSRSTKPSLNQQSNISCNAPNNAILLQVRLVLAITKSTMLEMDNGSFLQCNYT